jgi:hypothetical protein
MFSKIYLIFNSQLFHLTKTVSDEGTVCFEAEKSIVRPSTFVIFYKNIKNTNVFLGEKESDICSSTPLAAVCLACGE